MHFEWLLGNRWSNHWKHQCHVPHSTLNENHIVNPTVLLWHFVRRSNQWNGRSPGDPISQWLEHPTGVTEVLGLIPTGNPENLFSGSLTHCQVTITYIITAINAIPSFTLSFWLCYIAIPCTKWIKWHISERITLKISKTQWYTFK